MRVAIVGGHGQVALLLAPILVAEGHEVSALFRNPDHTAAVAETGATPVVADMEELDTAAMADLFAGKDAVVWSAGAGGGNPKRTKAVDHDAAVRSMDAAVRAGADRYVMVSYFGAKPDHGVPLEHSFYPYAEAKAAADLHLKQSSLDWTILGPSALTNDPPTGKIEVGEKLPAGEVPRGDVAQVAAQVLKLPSTIGRFIAFNTGATPIETALT